MPTYEYACTECEHRFENFQSITSDPLSECPECKGKLRRLIGRGGALIFKGSGFYETDYKRSGDKGGKPDAASESTKSDSKSESSSSSSGSSGSEGSSSSTSTSSSVA
jgi:putative FmdB family regulatory protein